jgi:hypothetical protein
LKPTAATSSMLAERPAAAGELLEGRPEGDGMIGQRGIDAPRAGGRRCGA